MGRRPLAHRVGPPGPARPDRRKSLSSAKRQRRPGPASWVNREERVGSKASSRTKSRRGLGLAQKAGPGPELLWKTATSSPRLDSQGWTRGRPACSQALPRLPGCHPAPSTSTAWPCRPSRGLVPRSPRTPCGDSAVTAVLNMCC